MADNSMPVTDKSYIAAGQDEQYWHYYEPSNRNAKMQLLTVGGVCVVGHWYGKLGQYFKAWAPLLKEKKCP